VRGFCFRPIAAFWAIFAQNGSTADGNLLALFLTLHHWTKEQRRKRKEILLA
jgi:hypothetical protein